MLGYTTTLYEMLERIKRQQEARGIYTENMSEDQKVKYASECAHALLVEAAELSSSWAFASWKTTVTDKANIEREIIDCIFFLANIASCFGIRHTDLLNRFEWVLDNNYERIRNGKHKTLGGETQNGQHDNTVTHLKFFEEKQS